MKILDSGNRTEFPGGGCRDIQENKGRFDYADTKILGEWYIDFYEHYGSMRIYLNNISVLKVLTKHIENIDSNENLGLLIQALIKFIDEAYDGGIETALLNLAIHHEKGAKKYGVGNWKKGIPDVSFYNSAIRHYLKFKRGDDDEDHKSAFLFNLEGLYYNLINKDKEKNKCL